MAITTTVPKLIGGGGAMSRDIVRKIANLTDFDIEGNGNILLHGKDGDIMICVAISLGKDAEKLTEFVRKLNAGAA